VVTEQLLLRFLGDDLNIDTAAITPANLLFSSGIVDSFALITLMTFLESQCGFRIGPMEVTLENFDSVERILQFAERKVRENGA
jgi:acyl carrier protein